MTVDPYAISFDICRVDLPDIPAALDLRADCQGFRAERGQHDAMDGISGAKARACLSVEEDDSGEQVNRGESISSEFVVAGCDGAKVLMLLKKRLLKKRDEVTFTIEREIAIAFCLSSQQNGFFKNSSSAFVFRRPSALFRSGKRPNRTI
jgi:hypothetical protein